MNALLSKKYKQICTATLILMISADAAMAATPGTGTSLPWEAPLKMVSDSLSGPVAVSIAVIGFFIAGCVWVFGSDMTAFGSRICLAIMACSGLLLGKKLIETLFGTTGFIF